MTGRMLRPMAVGLVPLAALASLNCGILIAPIAGPKAMLLNAQKIKLSARIVDEAGNPLPQVTVHIERYKETLSVFGEDEAVQSVADQTVNGEFNYASLDNYALGISMSKAGYATEYLSVANKDSVPRFGWIGLAPGGRMINVSKDPHIVVVMHPKPEQK